MHHCRVGKSKPYVHKAPPKPRKSDWKGRTFQPKTTKRAVDISQSDMMTMGLFLMVMLSVSGAAAMTQPEPISSDICPISDQNPFAKIQQKFSEEICYVDQSQINRKPATKIIRHRSITYDTKFPSGRLRNIDSWVGDQMVELGHLEYLPWISKEARYDKPFEGEWRGSMLYFHRHCLPRNSYLEDVQIYPTEDKTIFDVVLNMQTMEDVIDIYHHCSTDYYKIDFSEFIYSLRRDVKLRIFESSTKVRIPEFLGQISLENAQVDRIAHRLITPHYFHYGTRWAQYGDPNQSIGEWDCNILSLDYSYQGSKKHYFTYTIYDGDHDFEYTRYADEFRWKIDVKHIQEFLTDPKMTKFIYITDHGKDIDEKPFKFEERLEMDLTDHVKKGMRFIIMKTSSRKGLEILGNAIYE